MNNKLKIAVPVVAGVLAISAGIGTAAAKASSQNQVYRPIASYQTVSNNNISDNTDAWYCGGFGGMMGYGVDGQVTSQVAALLGTTVTDLEAQLDSGKTLADIAAVKGISQDQLIQTIMAPYKDHLDLMVKYGYLTQDQMNNLTQQARQRLQIKVTSPSNSGSDWWSYMGGMMYGWGGGNGPQQQPSSNPVPQRGFGSMMGGYSGGMMGR